MSVRNCHKFPQHDIPNMAVLSHPGLWVAFLESFSPVGPYFLAMTTCRQLKLIVQVGLLPCICQAWCIQLCYSMHH